MATPTISAGYLGFQWGHGLSDWAIRVGEAALQHDIGSPRPLATHVYLLFTRQGRDEIVEAVPPKVRRLYAGPRPTSRLYKLPPCADLIRGYQYALTHVGVRYDRLGTWLCGLYLLTGHPDWFYNSRHAALFCSELVLNDCRVMGLDPLPLLPSCDATPADLEFHVCDRLERVQ